MKRGRFTEEQIIEVLKEHEAGAKTAYFARKQGISEDQQLEGQIGRHGRFGGEAAEGLGGRETQS
jgi:hypothetical protein